MAIAARINKKHGLVEGNLSGAVWRSKRKPGRGKGSGDMASRANGLARQLALSEQAVHLGEMREVTREPHGKGNASPAITGELARPASYPDVSLLMKMCAQRKAGRRQRAMYPSHGPLRFITSHSFHARLCHAKNEAPD